ncbi:MFS transporter [Pseudomonas sp. HR96]|uniref:MFS transporter n=1 Tax=Pseudomonas sp. HR96 TaxID=1027966 RepID=UPI002A758F0C|nr:MFS transporter [Pseudomonas sp. HR96]WPO98944.1 MFS transporter [Pseudomonas sp. HR96]
MTATLPPRRFWSLVFLTFTLLTFLAASSAPTPLYHLYQEAWAFSPAVLTLVFGVYALSLLGALLTVGSLSDYLGRKPVLLLALLLEIASMLLFIAAVDVAWLIFARVLQGFATGIATSSLGAALIDNDKVQGPLLNSLAPLLGMAFGALGSSLLAQFAPEPLRLVYIVALGMFVFQAILLTRLPESVSRMPGALASLKPTLHVPPQARGALLRVLPINTATWSLGGFFLSLAPSAVRAITGSTSNLIGGALVAVMTLAGAAAIYSLRNRAAEKVLRLGGALLACGLAVVLVAAQTGSLGLFFVGTLIAGGGFGSGFLGSVRSVMPQALAHERAGLMATFYVLSYLAFCVPSFIAGALAKRFGLLATTDGYALAVIVLCVLALLNLMRRRSAVAGS